MAGKLTEFELDSSRRQSSGELVRIRSLRIHVLRLRSTFRSSSLISGWRRSHADQRGAGMMLLPSVLLSASHRIRTYSRNNHTELVKSFVISFK